MKKRASFSLVVTALAVLAYVTQGIACLAQGDNGIVIALASGTTQAPTWWANEET